MTESAKYRLLNFENVRDWHVNGKMVIDNDEVDYDEYDDHVDLKSRCMRSREAYKKTFSAKLSLACHVKLLGVIPDLIKTVSSEFDAVRSDVVIQLENLQMNLTINSNPTGAERLLNSIFNKYFKEEELTSRAKDVLIKEFKDSVIKAAKAAKESFDKHIKNNLGYYGLRMRYCIHNESDGSDDPCDDSWTPEFFGCSQIQFGNEIIVEWLSYRKEWFKRRLNDPKCFETISSYSFWIENKHKWPTISDCALWWINFPTSNICVERGFALGRVIDSPRRGAMSWETFSQELMLKCNQFILNDLMNESLDKMVRSQK